MLNQLFAFNGHILIYGFEFQNKYGENWVVFLEFNGEISRVKKETFETDCLPLKTICPRSLVWSDRKIAIEKEYWKYNHNA